MSRPLVPPELARAWLTADLPAIPGRIRAEVEDFEVEEVPLYEPSGEGDHLYLRIEKRGIPTDEAVRRIARRLRVQRTEIGYAGLKDARAVTRQTLSVPRVAPEAAAAIEDDQLRLLDARRHRNKLKLGHLAGNRFRIRIQGAGPALEPAQAVLARLAARGAPNYFGLQRFGRARTTHLLGRALVAEDAPALVAALLGGEGAAEGTDEGPRVEQARLAAREGDWPRSLELWPPSCTAEQAACRALARGREPADAVRAIPMKWRTFYVAAFQSWLFNAYLTRRLDRIDRLEAGDVAFLHRNGAAFVVEDVDKEQPRCQAFEISPSGPTFGKKLLRPAEGSAPRADEDAVLAELAPGLGPELTPAFGAKPQGQRRPLRIPLRETAAEAEGEDLLVRFFLPSGCYATSVLEELFKRQVD